MRGRITACFRATGLVMISTLPNVAGAQSSVTIYGALDAYVARYTATNKDAVRGLNSGFNPNNLGFAMREDLGDGYSAGGVLEMQPNLDTGISGQGGKAFGRQSFVYLGGAFGTLSLGRIHTPGRAVGIKQAATGWLASDPGGNLMIAMGTSLAPAMNVDTTGSRLSNAAHYVSPAMGGVKVTLMHSLAEGQTLASGSAKVSTAGLAYASGALSIDFVYSKVYDIVGQQVGQHDFVLGAAYDFKVAKLFGTVLQRKGSATAVAGSVAPVTGSDKSDHMFHFGVSIPIAPTDAVGISAAWLRVDDAHRGRFAANMSPPFASLVDNATAWSIAYTKYLSKRTQLFASYGSLKNDALGTASFNPGFRPAAGKSSSLLAAGVRHSF